MEDNALAEKTLRSRLENMDPAQLAAVGIAVSLACFLLKKNICCLN